jgi:preprotein translocase subunit YajC
MANIAESLSIASIILFIAGLFVVMLYERERAKEKKHAER